jgi:hypothetical protein
MARTAAFRIAMAKRNMIEKIARRKIDRSYQNKYKAFVLEWAEANGFRKPGTTSKYIHQPAVHVYFLVLSWIVMVQEIILVESTRHCSGCTVT